MLTDLDAIHQSADWDRAARLYLQCLEAIADPDMPYLPLQLPAFLAELAGRLSTSYYHREYALVTDAYEAMSHGFTSRNSLYFDSRFTALPEYQPGGTGARRRRPTPFEAVVETARRLRDLNTLEDSLRGTDCGALLGGSCSYGRFFNIVGQSEGSASDLDLLIVASDNDALREIVLSALAGFALDTSAVASSKARLRDYLDYSTPTKSEFVVFSHKVPLWTRNDDPLLADINIDASYNLSLHLMPQLVADQIMLADVPLITTASAGSERYVTDFRETPAARTDHQRSFSGKNIRIPLREDGFRDSYARRTVAFKIGDGDQYFPGMFQNLILPLFDVRWGPTSFRRSVDTFRWKMVERLRYERRIRSNDLLRISLSHTRRAVFAPHVIRGLDGSTYLP